VKVVNLFGGEWDLIGDREGYRIRDAHVGMRLGAELIGGSLYELDPGVRRRGRTTCTTRTRSG
jgi:hypothetical protein